MRARSSARGLGRSRVVKGNDERRKHCRYGTWLQRMVERLVANLAMRKAKVRDDGIEPGHLVATRHRLSDRRDNRISRSRAGVRANRTLRKQKGSQKKAGDELSVLPRHRPTVYFNVQVTCLRLRRPTARLSVWLASAIRAPEVLTIRGRQRRRHIRGQMNPGAQRSMAQSPTCESDAD